MNHPSFADKYDVVDLIHIEPVSTARVNRIWYLEVSLSSKDLKDAGTSLKLVLKVTNPAWKHSKTLTEVNTITELRRRSPSLSGLLPKILSFSTDSLTSKIGSEYILMTRLSVRQILPS
jgi:hypothetical protein